LKVVSVILDQTSRKNSICSLKILHYCLSYDAELHRYQIMRLSVYLYHVNENNFDPVDGDQ